MANDDVRQLILGWCGTGDDVQMVLDGFYTVEERSEPDADVVLALKSSSGDLVASLQTGSDRLVLRRTDSLGSATPDGNLADALQEIEDRCPGPVTVALDPAGDRQVVLSTWVILDGLSKHTFLTAVSDLERTRRAVVRLGGANSGSAATSSQAVAAEQPAPVQPAPVQAAPVQPWPVQTPVDATSDTGAAGSASFGSVYQPSPTGYGATQPSPAAAAGFTPSYPAQGYGQPYTPSPAVTATPTPTPAPTRRQTQAGWMPSHKVPPQGMQAWAAPDPNGAVVATLGGHLPVQVTETRGAWAHVVCSNGWTGWVDGRLLVTGA